MGEVGSMVCSKVNCPASTWCFSDKSHRLKIQCVWLVVLLKINLQPLPRKWCIYEYIYIMVPPSWVFEDVWWMTLMTIPIDIYRATSWGGIWNLKNIPKKSKKHQTSGLYLEVEGYNFKNLLLVSRSFFVESIEHSLCQSMIPRMRGANLINPGCSKITRQDLRSKDSHLCQKYVTEVVVCKSIP